MSELIILDCEQGSEEWFTARCGIPTATGIKNIVTASGERSSSWIAYLAELLAERIEGREQSAPTPSMQRGTELEPLARVAYEWATGNTVQQVGGVYLNTEKELMISPDGLIPEKRKGLEIKCPKMKTHIKYILQGGVPPEYIIQVQSALWVTGYETWDFVSYCPEYQAQTLYLFTATRDEKLMKSFDIYIPEFLKKLNTLGAKNE